MAQITIEITESELNFRFSIRDDDDFRTLRQIARDCDGSFDAGGAVRDPVWHLHPAMEDDLINRLERAGFEYEVI